MIKASMGLVHPWISMKAAIEGFSVNRDRRRLLG